MTPSLIIRVWLHWDIKLRRMVYDQIVNLTSWYAAMGGNSSYSHLDIIFSYFCLIIIHVIEFDPLSQV